MPQPKSAIQLFEDKAVLTFSEMHQFQFCKRCKTGEHLKALVAYIAPDLDISGLKRQSLTFLEHQYYQRFAKNYDKRLVKDEMQRLLKELHKRLGHLEKKRASS